MHEIPESVWKKMADEPFRLFFPLGTLHVLVAVLFWPLKVFGIAFVATPSQFHSFLQIYGFMGAFVTGFITTALPRLTGTSPLRSWELSLLLAHHAAIVGTIYGGFFAVAPVLFAAQIFVLLFILGRRFARRRRNPPESFIFIPFAFAAAIFGNLFLGNFFGGWIEAPFELYDLGVSLSFQGFILFLLLGVGGFLIRSILGWAPALPSTPSGALVLSPFNRSVLGWHFLAAVTLFSGFFVEAFVNREVGLILRAVAVTLEAVQSLKIHRKTTSGKLTSLALQISMWLLVAGCWALAAMPPQYAIGLEHFVLAGGFGMTTFAVATRVILSHCGHSALLNATYRPFSVAMVCFFIALLVRVSADFIPQSYDHHLAYAGILWGIGVTVWSFSVLKNLR